MADKHTYKQLGANELCPCGSGKTYIECCLDGNVRWLIDENNAYVKMQNFNGVTGQENTPTEEIPLLKIDVNGGKIVYSKNSHLSRFASFPPDMLKMCLSVIEVEKAQSFMEAFSKYIDTTGYEENCDDNADANTLADGSYVLMMISVNAETGEPLGMGGHRISSMLSESSLLTLIGALEEIKTDLTLCLTVNCLMNGMMGAVDYGEKE